MSGLLLRLGTTTCPGCGTTQGAFRRGFLDPRTRLRIYAVSIHFLPGGAACPGVGKRVARDSITRIPEATQ